VSAFFLITFSKGKIMALVKYGVGIAQMSGSVGGTTFARNKSGNYARNRTKPVNQNTSAQQIARSAIGQLTAMWGQVLTALQRAAWNLYASNLVMQNRLGDDIFLSGFNHFIRSNAARVQSGFDIVADGPTIFELPAKDASLAITPTENNQIISVAYNDTMDWLDEDGGFLFLYQGRPQNAQRNFFAGPYKLLAVIEGDSVTPPTTPEATAVIFAIAEGQRQWITARIGRADGRLSEPFRADEFVGAGA